ncbi:MAG: hypothetical protein J6A01_04410 [Proteobacteria bacterium]|nr:hypothetical protein [Pseudomonadota bacterium]
MKKRLAFLLFVSLCAMNACSDGSNNSDNPTPDAACNPDEFAPTCPSETSYTACIDNTIVTQACGDNQVCEDGECKEVQDVEPECTAKNYEPTCPSDTTYTACEEGKIVTKDCPEGQTCQDGACTETQPPAEDECDPESYTPTCADDTHKTVCGDDKKLTQEDCSEGMVCIEGECVIENPCDEAEFKPECTDDTHYTVCVGGIQSVEACEGDLVCFKGVCKQKSNDDGKAVPEEEEVTDDSDVLGDAITLPQLSIPLPDDPCLKCTYRQKCVYNSEKKQKECSDNIIPYDLPGITTGFTNEAGIEASFSLILTQKPKANVTFDCKIYTTSPYPEASINCSSLQIPKDDWTVTNGDYHHTNPVTFKVKGLSDDIDDGDQAYYILITTVSDDPDLNNISYWPMKFYNGNVNHAGVVWHADAPLLVGEDGRQVTYTLALQSKPLAPVKLKLRSSDITEGTVSPKTITFKPDDWNKPQTVTVTGVDDDIYDHTVEFEILTTAVSKDPKYDKIKIPAVRMVNNDDDLPGITISSKTYKLTPADNTTEVGVILSTEPKADVNVTMVADVNTSDNQLIAFEPEKLKFTKENWNVPQNVKVVYHDKKDNKLNVDQAVTQMNVWPDLSESEDPDYKMLLDYWSAYFDLYAYDSLDYPYEGKEREIELLPGEYNLQVWGSQGGGANMIGGCGGYSYGTVEFTEKTKVYIHAGGLLYNGGGQAQAHGGGASHIATVSGKLPELSDKRDKVLIVAGGGGGSERAAGGYGGGEVGGKGDIYRDGDTAPTGASQTEGGKAGHNYLFGDGTDGTFGQAGNGIGQITENTPSTYTGPDSGGGGGGGWYGGGGIPYAGGGGGGTGHIGTGVKGETIAGNKSFDAPTGGTETGHSGTGHARISIVERELPPIN